MIPRTYDETQMAAVLTRCTVCRRDYFMTKPQAVCVRCRQMPPKRNAEAGSSDEPASVGAQSLSLFSSEAR